MKQTKKIRIVIEADIHQDTELTPEVIKRIWGRNLSYPEMLSYDWVQESIGHNQALLSALLTNSEQYHRFLLEAIKYALTNATDDNVGDFEHLAGLPEQDEPAIETVIEELPVDSKAYFHEMKEAGVLSENYELTLSSLQVDLTRVSVEQSA